MRAIAQDIKGKSGSGRNGQKSDRVGRAGVMRCRASLGIVALVRRHDLDYQPLAVDLRIHVPERQCAADMLALAARCLPPKQDVEKRQLDLPLPTLKKIALIEIPAVCIAPLA